MTGFVDVILRGLTLGAQAIAVGGVAFALLVLAVPPACDDARLRRALRVVAAAAGALALLQVCLLALNLGSAGLGAGFGLSDIVGTTYFAASATRVAVALVLAGGAWTLGTRPGVSRRALLALAVPAVVLVLGAAWISHAAARVDSRATPLALDALHQLAAAVWIGGLCHLLVSAAGSSRPRWSADVLRRFSALASASVAALVVGGVALSLSYVDGVRALVGTAYGVMLLTKVAILGLLLVLGALNLVGIRRASSGAMARLRTLVEVELGLGLTAVFIAASLTSLPVAADVQADRATPAEVAARLTPRLPTFASPALADMPIDDKYAPRTDADRAWSEYNHHTAGVFVFAMGVLAVLHGSGRAAWARHWPLIFLGLSVFLLIRNDPGAWPLGPAGFWESMLEPTVLQHRFFVLLVVAFGTFEWMVRSGRLRPPRCALVFPILCAVGGALLLTHSHGSLNLKEEFLTEISHVPLGLLGILVGWGRWLELRLPAGEGRLPARVWEWSFTLIGLVLLAYRES